MIGLTDYNGIRSAECQGFSEIPAGDVEERPKERLDISTLINFPPKERRALVSIDPESQMGGGKFHTTHWSAVLLSAQSTAPGSQLALAELCRIYWYPIYAFVRRKGYGPDDAQDLTQGFFLHLLEHKALTHVSPLKGKFRSFLLASLQNYLSDEADRARCIKRGGNVLIVPLDAESAEDRYQLVAGDSFTADKIFDARWAMTVLDEAMTRLGHEYAAQGKTSIFETLRPFLDPMNCNVALSYEEVAKALCVSVGSVKTLIHRLRKRFTCILREEIGRTVADPGEIDEEIHALCEALIATEGRLGP